MLTPHEKGFAYRYNRSSWSQARAALFQLIYAIPCSKVASRLHRCSELLKDPKNGEMSVWEVSIICIVALQYLISRIIGRSSHGYPVTTRRFSCLAVVLRLPQVHLCRSTRHRSAKKGPIVAATRTRADRYALLSRFRRKEGLYVQIRGPVVIGPRIS